MPAYPGRMNATWDRYGVTPARVEAAELLRRLGHALVGHHADDEVLERISAAAAPFVAELERSEPRSREQVGSAGSSFAGAPPANGQPLEHFPDCIVSGKANPMGVAIEVTREGDVAVATVTLGSAFEGAPGRSHGGIVAAIIDDIMGYQLSILGEPAFTGTLTVAYRAPTPMGVPLVFRAWSVGRDGRKLSIAADAHHGDKLIAEAEATFITIPLERFAL